MAAPVLNYRIPQGRRGGRPFGVFSALAPCFVGLCVGGAMIGLIVCYGCGAYIVALADTPAGFDKALEMWAMLFVVSAPISLAITAFVLVLLARPSLQARPWWVSLAIGAASPCVAVIAAFLGARRGQADLSVLLIAGLLLSIGVPWLLVRRDAAP